jgi:hypothetical protein
MELSPFAHGLGGDEFFRLVQIAAHEQGDDGE